MTYFKIFSLLALLLFSAPSHAGQGAEIKVFKSPYCSCCTAWSEHLRENGFDVSEIKRDDMEAVKRQLGVPQQLESCHTALIDGYVIEGHVPADDIKRLIKERPKGAKGLSVPGMPIGSPGMEQGNHKDKYTTIIFGPEGMGAFARH
ncbi:conserved exported hypothetical protein [Candidatus Terasakiella magnetica]|uniref:Metal-binding protein n=1 Tax=Candidatus Terasakiella magnetica TaxID=1867952 RepID=A0A1C3RIB1_9PROT|nr:DUF411 domain-containing protein [Candidatus Terasakiella magnetica]SCA57000.1 conserved exported hypothetical protein [Candidatus Terasakiella magnetica]